MQKEDQKGNNNLLEQRDIQSPHEKAKIKKLAKVCLPSPAVDSHLRDEDRKESYPTPIELCTTKVAKSLIPKKMDEKFFFPDIIYPTDNDFEIPTLRLDMQAQGCEIPFVCFGEQKRTYQKHGFGEDPNTQSALTSI